MAIHYRTQGFILKKIDRGEADRIFVIYSKDFGKIEILGKAIRKIKAKLRSFMEQFFLTEIEFIEGKTHRTLTDAILIENFKKIREDLKKLKTAHQVGESLDQLISVQEKDEKIWQLIKEVFYQLNDSSRFSFQLFYFYFLLNLISLLGWKPQLESCALCQKKAKEYYFSAPAGGTICFFCFKKERGGRKIEKDTLEVLKILLKKRVREIEDLKIDPKIEKSTAFFIEDFKNYLKNQLSS